MGVYIIKSYKLKTSPHFVLCWGCFYMQIVSRSIFTAFLCAAPAVGTQTSESQKSQTYLELTSYWTVLPGQKKLREDVGVLSTV